MKCKYCGNNLNIEDAVCPYCGKENDFAADSRALMDQYRAEFENTEKVSKKRSLSAGRLGRLIVIGILLSAIAIMGISIMINSDAGTRIDKNERMIAKKVAKNKAGITATLEEMEKNRDYLGMSYYMLNYRLRSEEDFNEYQRVFTAVIDYSVIYEDIINIVTGFNKYDSNKDMCDTIALHISEWHSYVDGEFWNDRPDSPMHAGEHDAFISDAKKAVSDMVMVYFELTPDQADDMWDMDKEYLSELLYSKCLDLYPEGNADE